MKLEKVFFKKLYLKVLLVSFIIVAFDILLKLWIVERDLNYTINTGFILGSFTGNNFFAMIVNTASVVLLALFIRSDKFNKLEKVSLTLTLGASFSNLFDRIIHRGVIDYIHILNLPVFNLSDMVIVISLFILIASIFTHRKPTQA